MRGFKQHLRWDYVLALIWIYSVLVWALRRRRNYNPSEKHMNHRLVGNCDKPQHLNRTAVGGVNLRGEY